MPTLFDPLTIGELTLKNRIVMAPMTRSRSGVERVPGPLVAEYYRQRAGAGLIISEGVVVTPGGVGYADTPGLWNAAQVEGWKGVTRAVHEAGGLIFAQLWHVGRITDPSFLNGLDPVAPSAIAAGGDVSQLRPKRPHPLPRALSLAEIKAIVEAFRVSAENAERAGFDGVELHGANGYLLDQFLQDSANRREDEYGGPVENRARLMFEVADAAASVFGGRRVGLHLAPRADGHSMGDSDLAGTFAHVAREARARDLAFLMARERVADDRIGPSLKAAFGGVYIANEGFNQQSAEAILAAGDADAVGFGKLFIANPDLPARFRAGAELNRWNMETFYGPGGAEGYTDYPALEAVTA